MNAGGDARLLVDRRFGPFFLTQLLGALNDNLFKNAMVLLLSFKAASEADSGLVTNLAAGLFILPFFLFSSVAGQLADKFDKSRVIRAVKTAEIGIMALGAVGFFTGSSAILYFVLFLMGTHSAFFGPVKYSILPVHLRDEELMAGNGFVEMGTFIAILVGTMAGGILHAHTAAISAGVVGVAVLGLLASRFVPAAPASAPDLKLNWNPFTEAVALAKLTQKKESVFNSILGISWYWYYGATVLAQLASFTRYYLHGNEQVYTLLMGVFVLSIAVGSLLCMWLARGEIELGLVPIGAVGMSLFLADLFFVQYPSAPADVTQLLGWREYLWGAGDGQRWRVVFDFAMTGVFSSLFIVPLYALIQHRSDEDSRSRVIAANNVFNSVFMVVSAVVTMGLYKLGFNTIAVFLYTAILNLVVSVYVFSLVPEFVMRFGCWVLANTIYRLRFEGRDQIPRTGAAVIVANHVSFIDWFIVTAACRRPVRFVMDHRIFKMPVIGLLFRLAKAIPIAPAKEDDALKEKAFERISAELKDGCLVCIFPEGKITYDGTLDKFRPGIERILRADPVPVVPIALAGLWGSFFSRSAGRAMSTLPKPKRRVIEIKVGAPLAPSTPAAVLQSTVAQLLPQAS
jgi:1-acyl-sn-glycerol-3-phosphate acyltransferase